jgi:hypothetical protein
VIAILLHDRDSGTAHHRFRAGSGKRKHLIKAAALGGVSWAKVICCFARLLLIPAGERRE